MNIKIILIGKTDNQHIHQLTEDYIKRIARYIQLEWIIIEDIKNRKNLTAEEQKKQESELILKKLSSNDFVVLLDERGKKFNSLQFSDFLQKRMLSGIKSLVFIIGGPYGFAEQVYKIANYQLSISDMTFSHQIIRVIFAEQLYRVFTILNHEPYHHQ